jgi:thioredoxin reductase (NADPH)
VHIAHRGERLRARRHLVERVEAEPKIAILWKTTVEAILGGRMVEKARLRRDGRTEEIACAGVFAYIGLEPSSGFAPAGIARDAGGHLVTNAEFETSVAGLWAIGAVRAGYSGLLRDAVDEAEGVAQTIASRLKE